MLSMREDTGIPAWGATEHICATESKPLTARASRPIRCDRSCDTLSCEKGNEEYTPTQSTEIPKPPGVLQRSSEELAAIVVQRSGVQFTIEEA
jgi:hypothetical protein